METQMKRLYYTPNFINGQIIVGSIRIIARPDQEAVRNEMAQRIGAIIHDSKGLLGTEIDRALPTYWGCLDHSENAADQALEAAFAIRQATEEVNQRLGLKPETMIQVGISLWSFESTAQPAQDLLRLRRALQLAMECSFRGMPGKKDLIVEARILSQVSVKLQAEKIEQAKLVDEVGQKIEIYQVKGREVRPAGATLFVDGESSYSGAVIEVERGYAPRIADEYLKGAQIAPKVA